MNKAIEICPKCKSKNTFKQGYVDFEDDYKQKYMIICKKCGEILKKGLFF